MVTNTSTRADLAKDFLVDGEGEVQDVGDVVVFHPLQRLVELLVQILQIRQVCRPVEHTEVTHATHKATVYTVHRYTVLVYQGTVLLAKITRTGRT